MSIEEFAAMTGEEAIRVELVRGEPVPLEGATPQVALIRDGLVGLLRDYLGVQRLGIAVGEVDCRTTYDTVRRPDLSYFSRERWLLVDPRRIPLPFTPDIAVEILSPSEKAVEVNSKVAEYLAAGSVEVWVIDPQNIQLMIRSANAVRVLGAGDRLESPLLPGFSFGVSEALAGPEL